MQVFFVNWTSMITAAKTAATGLRFTLRAARPCRATAVRPMVSDEWQPIRTKALEIRHWWRPPAASRRVLYTLRTLSFVVQASAAPASSYMLLQYSYVPDILEKRGPYREQHLAGANKMVGGALRHVQRGPCQRLMALSHTVFSLCTAMMVPQAEENKLVMAGALAEPVDGAVFIFRCAW